MMKGEGMTDARNVYPRLCWGCLGIIDDYGHDHWLLDCGGCCDDCSAMVVDELQGLRQMLRGESDRMNNVSEQENILRELKQWRLAADEN
jgi:hypothetical protein